MRASYRVNAFWTAVLSILCLIPAVVCHEVAHGYVAYRLGDPTAKIRGRLTLNPVKHVDPFGTVFLPLMLTVLGGPVFGWAKPVPINPAYFRDYRKGMLYTGLAGPAVNLVFAVAGGLAARGIDAIVMLFGVTGSFMGVFIGVLWYVAFFFAYINLVLLFFNLIPIPPLDGSRVLPMFLSNEALVKYHRFERYGIMIFFLVVLVLPNFIGIDLIGRYFSFTVYPILELLTGISLW